MGRDNPDRLLYTRLNASIFQEHPLRHPIIGYRELIAGVTRDIMVDYYAERYTPGRCFWVIVGDAEPERAFDLVEAEMADWERRSLAEPAIPPEPAQCTARGDAFSFRRSARPARLRRADSRNLGIRTSPAATCWPAFSAWETVRASSALPRSSNSQLAGQSRSFSCSQGAGGLLAVTASCRSRPNSASSNRR